MNTVKIVAIIPARGGSKSIPLKNIKLINNRPLIYWTIDAALQCTWIDEVYVSTDSEEIKRCVNLYDNPHDNRLYCINRDSTTATDSASTESVLLDFTKKVTSDFLILIQATSPLTDGNHLNEAFEKYFKNRFDSMLSVVEQKRFIWEKINGSELVRAKNYVLNERPRRQDFNGYLVENGAFYITKTTLLKQTGIRISGEIGVYKMPEETYFEVDEPEDWIIIEKLLKKKVTRKLQKNIKLFATDCDGVLTDAGMYYSEDGDVLKKFNTKDGMGFAILHKRGIKTAILTGENSEIVLKRAEKLKVDDVYLGCNDKVAAMEELLLKYDLSYDEVAYIGDDINDIELLKKVGFSFSVADALKIVKNVTRYTTLSKGGEGAVREAIEILLKDEV